VRARTETVASGTAGAEASVSRNIGCHTAAEAGLLRLLTDTAEAAGLLVEACRIRLTAPLGPGESAESRWRRRTGSSLRKARLVLRNAETSIRKLERRISQTACERERNDHR
jgi:hypothetical protein